MTDEEGLAVGKDDPPFGRGWRSGIRFRVGRCAGFRRHPILRRLGVGRPRGLAAAPAVTLPRC
jgi:hypothetical protein